MANRSVAIPLERFTSFGDLLRFLRRRAGLTQRELSVAVGYSHAQVSRLELNQRAPDVPTVAARFIPALHLDSNPDIVTRMLDLAGMPAQPAPASGSPPFKGLQYFEEADADLFFGRETLTGRLAERLYEALSASPPRRFLAVVGASGIGKSSIVRAGLVPVIRQDRRSRTWQIHALTPTAHPLQALAEELAPPDASLAATASLIDDLAAEPRALHLLAGRLAGLGKGEPSQARVRGSETPRLLLIIDQFEELFSLCRSESERQAFIRNLMNAVTTPEGPVLAVMALRADFYNNCAGYEQLRQGLAENQEYIGPMNSDELRHAIEGPARWGRWELESGLIEVLLQDVGASGGAPLAPGAMPLLSHALLETWHRRSARTLTVSGYLASGGVRGAIAETADEVYQDRLDVRQQAIARSVFLRLTQLGEDESLPETRRRVGFAELIPGPEEAPAVREVLTVLADARLITTDNDVAEVAHEALIREWPTLREWLETDREGLRLHRHLTLSADSWDRRTRDSSELYRGTRLAQALQWAAVRPSELNELERQFLSASQEHAEQEAADREDARQRELRAARELAETQTQAARQLRRRAVYLTAALLLTLAMAGVALFFGEQARQTALAAQADRRVATARELAAAALNNLNVDPERSILLALRASATTRAVDGIVLPEAVEALHRSIIASPVRLALAGHGTRVLSATFSPDGRRLATIGDDGTTIVWDPDTGEEILRLPGSTVPGDLVTAQRVAYSPDGKLLAALDNWVVNIHDPLTGQTIRTLAGPAAELTAVAFDAAGGRVAAGAVDGSVWIWDVLSGRPLVNMVAHADALEKLAFSPDGLRLVTASSDTTMGTWDAGTGESVHDGLGADGEEPTSYQDFVYTSLSRDGTLWAQVSGNEVEVTDSRTGRELTLAGHTGWVMGTEFSPDGDLLATTSLDGTVRLWDIGPGLEIVVVAAPVAGYGTRVAYSPDGRMIASNGGDGTATLWDGGSGEPRLTVDGHDLEVLNIAFSADGERFATASLDGTAIVWDSATGAKLLTLAGHEFGVRDIAFSPDSTRIATGGFDNIARIWDAATGEELHRITGHDGLVLGVAFSPDSLSLATSSTDGTGKIWDVESGQLLITLAGAGGGPDVAFSPDGSKLATGGGDGTARIWDAATGAEALALEGHGAGVYSVAFSPDGSLLATGSGDNSAKVWDVMTGQEVLTLPGSGGVYGVSFNPVEGGAHLAVASNDGVVRVFLTSIDDVLALARSRVTRSLTIPECQKFLHVQECPAGP